MKTLALIFTLSSVVLACPRGSEPYRDGVCAADIKPAEGEIYTYIPSNEKPPRGKNNPWEANNIHVVNLENTDVADRNHPKDCDAKCVWTGAQCLCNEDPAKGKRP